MKRTIITALFLTTSIMTSGEAAGHTVDWEPCEYEDGSSQKRCIWDAKHMGNGEGSSLKVTNGGEDNAVYKVISHRKAKHLLGSNH